MRFRFLSSIAALLCAATAAHAAPARTLDVTKFSPPDGFEIDDKSTDHVAMTNTAPGRYGVIAVFAGRPATGDLQADFKTQWHDAVEHMMQPDELPTPTRGTMPGGAAVLAGSATAKMDGKPVYTRLFVIDGGAKVVAIVVVTPGSDIYDRYEDDVNKLIAGATVTRSEPQPPAPPPPPPAPKPAKPAPGAKPAPAAPPPSPPPPPYKLVPLPEDPALPAAPTVDAKKLVGEWQHSTGRAADKDSVIYGDLWTLNNKKRFEYRFIGRNDTQLVREDDGGGYAYKDGRLLLLGNKRGTSVLRVSAWKDDKSGTSVTFLPDGMPATEGNAAIFSQTWERPKKGRGKH